MKTRATQQRTLRSMIAVLAGLGLASITFAGCGEADGDPGEEMWDEGPPADEPSADAPDALDPEQKADDGSAPRIVAATAPPRFQLPFPCNQAWLGQTRTNHSPVNSIDFNRTNDQGDPVVAAAAGTVARVENLGNTSYGRWIEIDHGGGWRTRYAHLSVQRVTRGQRVRQGQRIGDVGNTGGSSGAHLHYEQRLNGIAERISFNGTRALYFGTRTYTSKNGCGGGGGGGTGGVSGRVDTDSGAAVTVRSGPGTSFAAVGSVADGATVRITCQKRGQTITGKFGTTNLWDFIGNGYVSDAFVFTGADGQVAPTCP